MGKRKGTRPKAKVSSKLSTTFDCPFCNHSRCVETKLEKKRSLGTLLCRICNANYSTRISALTEPVDVYSDWIDRAEEENSHIQTGYTAGREVASAKAGGVASQRSSHHHNSSAVAAGADSDDDAGQDYYED
eukprot:Lankesteria_metandrocarpae@DN5335_c0_g1_i2.p1